MKRIHSISLYMMLLSVTFLVLALPGAFWILSFFFHPEKTVEQPGDFWWIAALVVISGITLGIILIFFVFNAYESFGFWKTKEKGIRFFAFFRRGFLMPYTEIKYIGIDFAILNGARQFWIYLSSHEIDMKYHHKINRLPFRKDCMRLQFSQVAYDELLKSLPKDLAKQLNRSYSIIRLYHR